MSLPFQIAVGSVPGRDHVGRGNLLEGMNNQDSWRVHLDEELIIAVVCDGCGSQAHSEVGSNLVAEWTIEEIVRGRRELLVQLASAGPVQDASLLSFEWLREAVLARMRVFLSTLGRRDVSSDDPLLKYLSTEQIELRTKVFDYLLCTTVAAIITPSYSLVLSLGDGRWGINTVVKDLGPYPDDSPPYLAYGLMPWYEKPYGRLLKYKVQLLLPTSQLEVALAASDGASKLDSLEDTPLPGKTRFVGPFSNFWSERFFPHPDEGSGPFETITPYLRMVNSEVVKLEKGGGEPALCRSSGLLPDDTTIVVIRRTQSTS